MVLKTLKEHEKGTRYLASFLIGVFATALWYISSWAYNSLMKNSGFSDGEKLIILLLLFLILLIIGVSIIFKIELNEIKNDILEKMQEI